MVNLIAIVDGLSDVMGDYNYAIYEFDNAVGVAVPAQHQNKCRRAIERWAERWEMGGNPKLTLWLLRDSPYASQVQSDLIDSADWSYEDAKDFGGWLVLPVAGKGVKGGGEIDVLAEDIGGYIDTEAQVEDAEVWTYSDGVAVICAAVDHGALKRDLQNFFKQLGIPHTLAPLAKSVYAADVEENLPDDWGKWGGWLVKLT